MISAAWRVFALAGMLGASGLAAGQALDFNQGFSLPSGRLQCQLDASGSAATVRCDVLQPTFTRPSRPADCPLEYGDSLYVGVSGNAAFTCHGDTVVDPARPLPVLAYGQLWQRAGLTCRSSLAGVRCLNIDAHGFELARAKYRIF